MHKQLETLKEKAKLEIPSYDLFKIHTFYFYTFKNTHFLVLGPI